MHFKKNKILFLILKIFLNWDNYILYVFIFSYDVQGGSLTLGRFISI